jgi:ferritin-like metal-binding protein YciE
MIVSKSNMRLFNGHQKIEQESLQKIFLMQLNNIYCIKTYLVANLPVMAAAASFIDLKNAIVENVDEIKVQLLRMEAIYAMMGETYNPQQCIGIRAFTMEAYAASKLPGMTHLETDLIMLYNLVALESLEQSCYTTLHEIAKSLPESDVALLLKQNLDMAKDSKELYTMIIREYIN